MKVIFRGVRGTLPVTQPEYLRYGGNTPCVQVEAGDGALLIDAGTGIRAAGRELVRRGVRQIHLLLSHTHWDHIQGFPHFAPLYQEQVRIAVYALRHPDQSLHAIFRSQQQPAFFPVPLEAVKAQVDFVELEDGQGFAVGEVGITCRRLNHPGVVGGFRLEHQGKILAYLCDVDLATPLLLAAVLGADSPARRQEQVERLRQGARDLAHRADLVVVDTFFLPEEYEPDWGHGRPDDVLHLALEAQVRGLAFFHHKPERTDEQLDRLAAQYRPQVQGRLELIVAAEGLELSL